MRFRKRKMTSRLGSTVACVPSALSSCRAPLSPTSKISGFCDPYLLWLFIFLFIYVIIISTLLLQGTFTTAESPSTANRAPGPIQAPINKTRSRKSLRKSQNSLAQPGKIFDRTGPNRPEYIKNQKLY